MRAAVRRSLLPVAAGVLLAATLSPATAEPADPAGTIRVTPDVPSGERASVLAEAGDASYVVMSTSSGFVARAVDGTRSTLATSPAAPPGFGPFSLTGATLTAGARDSFTWWDLAAHSTGSVTLPSGQVYLASAPDGVLVRDGSHLLRRSLAGSVTDLGQPFSTTDQFAVTAVGDDGFVVQATDPSQPRSSVYQAFGSAGSFTPLTVPGASRVDCDSVAGPYAGCAVDNPDRLALVPVDGVRPATTTTQLGGPLAVAGSRLLWLGGASTTLHSLAYGATTVQAGTTPYGQSSLVPAYGAALVSTPDYTRLLQLSAATSTPTTVVTAGYLPTRASGIVMGPGRLTSLDDRQAGVAAPLSLFATEVTTSAPTLRVGATAAVHKGVGDLGFLASGASTVYRLGTVRAPGATVLRTPQGSVVVRAPAGRGAAAAHGLSGNRVLFTDSPADRRDRAYVLDASTGRRTVA